MEDKIKKNECKTCGKLTLNSKFCNRRCSGLYMCKIASSSRIGTKHTKKSIILISKNRKNKALRERNPRWNGGIGSYRKKVDLLKCERCGDLINLLVHHKDRNRHNNNMSNLEVLCYQCHCAEHKYFNRWGEYYVSN